MPLEIVGFEYRLHLSFLQVGQVKNIRHGEPWMRIMMKKKDMVGLS